MAERVDSVIIKEDIGGPYPIYKTVRLWLWSDGSVSWEDGDDG